MKKKPFQKKNPQSQQKFKKPQKKISSLFKLLRSFHPYHIVDQSPWPLLAAISALVLATGLLKMFIYKTLHLLILGLISLSLVTLQWCRDIAREASLQGKHSTKVTSGLKLGMLLFIISELFFFVSFFWAFFHSSLAPVFSIGMMWPPLSVTSFDPTQVPLLNTAILLTSGVTCTWAHNALIKGDYKNSSFALSITITLGLTFTILQGWEYQQAPFTMADSIYGATFFMATGFHGMHVIIGTLFLAVSLIRLVMMHYSTKKHFGFEAGAWYWHFVDVIWLLLYLLMYWWGA